MTMPVGVQDCGKGGSQVQGNTRFKAHSSAGAVQGRDKGMLQCKKITRQILTCSAVTGARQCQDEIRIVW